MLKRRIVALLSLALTIVMASGCTMFSEDYVAKVGPEKIAKSEYNFFLKDAQGRLESLFGSTSVNWTQKIQEINMTAGEYAKQIALDSAVDLEIQIMKAKEAKVSLTKKEIDGLNADIDASLKDLGTTGIEREKALKDKTGVTPKQFKDIYQKITLVKKFVSNVQGKYTATDADLKTHYDANKDRLDRATVGHILFLTTDTSGQALSQEKQDLAKKNAEDILAKVKAGDDFAALAKQYSEDPGSKESGGEITLAKDHTYVPEFENWALDPVRKVGDAEIVKTTYGYHVMKMKKVFTYDEIKDAVKNSYLSKKYSDDLAGWKKDTKKYAVEKNQKVLDPIKVPLT
jgi:foldase protein PrsA